ncbi:MAG: TIGR03936 family radical SAM-associated protein [Elusimicrobia bacterium]|nr:TIGR03936 family radical SAM-associated protein [Elusimicrobiota bacterium]
MKNNVYRLRFSRKGTLRFLSHLEQIELIKKCLKRSGLPLKYSEGFHPHMKVSFGPAISVSYESDCEFADVHLSVAESLGKIAQGISAVTPAGFSLVEVKGIPHFSPPVDAAANLCDYEVTGIDGLHGVGSEDDICDRIAGFLSKKEIFVIKRKTGKELNIRPLVLKLESIPGGFALSVRFSPGGNVKPERVVSVLLGLDEQETVLLRVRRLALYTEKPDGTLSGF